VRCAEGRTVKFSICRACAALTVIRSVISSPEVQAA
jgi:ribosomal protein L40E